MDQIVVPKLILQEPDQVLDESLIEVEDENRGTWKVICNSCHKEKWMSKWIRNRRTRRCALLEEPFYPQTGQIAKKHKCMFKGQGYWINKYDGSIEWAEGVTPDIDKVDERTKEIAVKKWRQNIGYQRLSKWELEQVEAGREYSKTFKIESKIK